MKYIKKYIIITLLIFLFTYRGFTLNNIQIDIDSIGTGNTGVANSGTTFSSYINPASLSFNKSLEFGMSYISKSDIPDYGIYSIGVNYIKPIFHWGIIFIQEELKDIISQQRFLLSTSYLIRNNISLGINAKVYRLVPSGYQETVNDPLVKTSIQYQADIGIIFIFNKFLQFGAVAYDFISRNNEDIAGEMYRFGITVTYSGYTMNADIKMRKSYTYYENKLIYSIGFKKELTNILTFMAGYENSYLTFGVGINVLPKEYISDLRFEYAYMNLAGPNHCIGVRYKF